MPNIAEYNATGEITPTDRGIQAAEVAGRRIGLYGHELAEEVKGVTDKVQQHMEVMETSELYKTNSDLELNLQQAYKTATAEMEKSGHYDPNFVNTFMAGTVNPQLEQWQSHASTDRGKALAAELAAQTRNSIFRMAAAGQGDMDVARYSQNKVGYINNQAAKIAELPSVENYQNIKNQTDAFIYQSAEPLPVNRREELVTQDLRDAHQQFAKSFYDSQIAAAVHQIEASGDPSKSLAYEQLQKNIVGKVGFDDLEGPQQQDIIARYNDVEREGLSRHKTLVDTAKAQITEQGKADYSYLHHAMTKLAEAGQGPTPELRALADQYVDKYAATNPGEVAALDDFMEHTQDRAMEGKVQPFNQNVRDGIQAGMGLPQGDPRRPTLPSLAKAYSAGQITSEDFNRYTEILNKLDKPSEDPSFKPAWENFTRWQAQMVESIGNKGFPGTSAARAQFLHDSTAAFMAQGHGGVGWDKALDTLTSAQNPHSFVHVISFYNRAANRSDAAQWLQQHDQFYANPHGTPALGSSSAPVYPTAQTPSQPAKMDQKDVDSVIWGPH